MVIKGVLLGAAIALTIASGARATDAIVADPNQLGGEQNVSACDAYGSGFFQLPGTHTCARIKGQLRYDMGVTSTSGHISHGRSTLDFETRSD
jgi:hypothetical protein